LKLEVLLLKDGEVSFLELVAVGSLDFGKEDALGGNFITNDGFTHRDYGDRDEVVRDLMSHSPPQDYELIVRKSRRRNLPESPLLLSMK
jgi:hypothetical protein